MKKLYRYLAATAVSLVLSAPAHSALMVDATFEVGFNSGGALAPGSFSGTDSNMDGLLEFGELSNFFWNGTTIGDRDASFTQLVSFASYDYLTNNWTPAVATVQGFTYTSYFGWNRNGGINATNAIGPATNSFVTNVAGGGTPVPEPMSLALFSAGLIGFGLSSRQRKKRIESV